MSTSRLIFSSLCLAAALTLIVACTPPAPDVLASDLSPTAAAIGPQDETARVAVYTPASGAEATGIAALANVFKGQHPDIEFSLQSSDGGDLRARLAEGQPPDSWLARIGKAFVSTSVANGQIEPLNHLYIQNGWDEAFSPDVMQWLGDENGIYSVPVAIHRGNILWYNPKVLEAAGVSPPGTLIRFPAALEELKAAGVDSPLVLGERWTAVHLFEVVMVAALGPRAYAGLWTGETDWESPEVVQAMADFALIVSYTNTDSIALDWQKAAQRVVDGQAAFYIMGDWVKSYYDEMGLQQGVDYDWTFAPGTATSFVFLSDGFVQSSVAAHVREAERWLTTAASSAGQVAYTRAVNALPAREPMPVIQFNSFQKENLQAWQESSRVGSMAHGLVIDQVWRAEIGEVMEQYLANRDIDAFQANLYQVCRRYGPCD